MNMVKFKQLIFYVIFFITTYFIYVYPYVIIKFFFSQENIFKISSIIFNFIPYILIIFYFKTNNTFFLLKLYVYEGMGIGFISFWIVNLGLLIDIFSSMRSFDIGIVSVLSIIIITIYSLINGRLISIKNIEIYSSKVKNKVRIIFLSDMHLGTNKKRHLEKIYTKINNLEFDLFLIGGDLLDSSSFKLEDLNIFNNIKKPILYINGNHECYLKDYEKKMKELNNYNLLFLDDTNFKFKNINIIGISDQQKLESQRKRVEKYYKEKLFNLVVVHKPTLWNKVLEKTDLMLSGHTHNGQIFPFNFIVNLQFKNIYGLYEKLNSKLYVSSGSGCWGPKMRLGSKNEIVSIQISGNRDNDRILN